MTELLEYSFRILGTSPETLPMSRLAVYLAELARLMGNQEGVHLARIDAGSVAIVMSAEQADIPLISPRIRGAAMGDIASEVAGPWRKINEYLAEDGWSAEMRLPRSAEIISFPGKAKVAKEIRSINQQTSVQGRLIRLEGAGDIVKVGLHIDGNLSARISLDATKAQELAPFFHRSVRLSGDGRWRRSDDGKWSLESLIANSFELLADSDIKLTLHELTEIIPPGSGGRVLAAVNELRRA
jgi:hypothetical protein